MIHRARFSSRHRGRARDRDTRARHAALLSARGGAPVPPCATPRHVQHLEVCADASLRQRPASAEGSRGSAPAWCASCSRGSPCELRLSSFSSFFSSLRRSPHAAVPSATTQRAPPPHRHRMGWAPRLAAAQQASRPGARHARCLGDSAPGPRAAGPATLAGARRTNNGRCPSVSASPGALPNDRDRHWALSKVRRPMRSARPVSSAAIGLRLWTAPQRTSAESQARSGRTPASPKANVVGDGS